MENKNWYTLTGKKIPSISEKLKHDVQTALEQGYHCNIVVGTDSQRHGNKVVYVTVIALIRQHNGGLGYYVKEIEDIPGINSNTTPKVRKEIIKNFINIRLMNEVVKSIDVANFVNDQLDPYNVKVNEIHCDINPNKRYKSSEMIKAIQGYIIGSEYTPIVKPEGWVASQICDKKTK